MWYNRIKETYTSFILISKTRKFPHVTMVRIVRVRFSDYV
nr:MAG TPA: hypothetical protein [Caudoviricetes sp.]